MMARTPIEAWPARTFRGSPGYSAKHYAALHGTPDDPLRVASRISCAAISDAVRAEADALQRAGDPFGEVMDWLSREITRRELQRWDELCASFPAVINVLAEAEQTPAIKRLLREARAAAKRAA